MLLNDLLSRAAGMWPDKLSAVFSESQGATFLELDRQSSQVAKRLIDSGISVGSRVALLYDNSLPALIYFWGVLKSGAATIDIPINATKDTLEWIFQESQPEGLIIHPHQFHRILSEQWQCCPELLFTHLDSKSIDNEILKNTLEEITKVESIPIQLPFVDASDVAMIIYTSGTTGRPKGVMLSHAAVLNNVISFNSKIKLCNEDSLLLIAPLYYIHGRIQLITHTYLGSTIFYSAGFQYPQNIINELVKYSPTGLSGVPYHFASLLRFSKIRDVDLNFLKNITITGGALSEISLRDLQAAIPSAELHLNYGQTEASPRLTYHGPSHEVFIRPNSCGRALPGVELNIIAEDGRILESGLVGEIVANTPSLMMGYVAGDEKSTGCIDAKGRLHTGDLGFLDDQGYLYLVGRSSEMIKSAGERVFPKEVEDVLQLHPAITESAVFGVPDPILGEYVVACVVCESGYEITGSELRKHCLKHLSHARAPKNVHFVEDIPKTASGKIKRDVLKTLFSS